MKKPSIEARKPRTLIYDIETAPIIGAIWTKWEANMIWSVKDWYILGFSYRWLGERKKTQSVFMHQFKRFKKEPENDYEVVKKLHELFNEADIIVAHNGNSFDQKKAQARMILQGFDPPSPYQQVDTKLVAKRSFNFTSNKLDDLGEYFGYGNKMKTDKNLWRKCLAGDIKAWNYMARYCDRDVELLEKVYLKMRPWDKQHPNVATISNQPDVCRSCGENKGFVQNGHDYTKTGKYKRYKCKNCFSNNRSRRAEKNDKPDHV
jgi:hypothetical protein